MFTHHFFPPFLYTKVRNHFWMCILFLTISLLICNHFSRKVVLQTRIFFLVGEPNKKVGLYYKSTFFQVGEKWSCKFWFETFLGSTCLKFFVNFEKEGLQIFVNFGEENFQIFVNFGEIISPDFCHLCTTILFPGFCHFWWAILIPDFCQIWRRKSPSFC